MRRSRAAVTAVLVTALMMLLSPVCSYAEDVQADHSTSSQQTKLETETADRQQEEQTAKETGDTGAKVSYSIKAGKITGAVTSTREVHIEAPDTAEEGTEVTFEVKDMSAANEAEKAEYVTADGTATQCERVEDADEGVIKYTFTMPGSDVTLDLTLTEKEHVYGTWDGTVDVRWYNGHEKDTEYEIYTPAELAGLAAIVNGKLDKEHGEVIGAYTEADNYWRGIDDMKGKTITLMSDMDMGGTKGSDGKLSEGPNYTPIGGQWCTDNNDNATQLSTSFNGTLDGAGHTVKNISCRRYVAGYYKNSQSIGLIGRMGCHDNDDVSLRADTPTVKNVAVTGYISGRRSVGGIVGKIGKTNKGGIIANCANFAEIKGTDSKGTGGIVGSAWNGGIVKNCYNAGHVENKGVNDDQRAFVTGGIAGSNECRVINCYNIGTVIAGSDSFAMALGTQNRATSSFTNCYFLRGSAPGGGAFITKGKVDNSGEMSEAEMQSAAFVKKLGAAFTADDGDEEINGGYPILKWQKGRVPKVNSIEISGSPLKTEEVVGRHFSYDGITATAHYDDGSSDEVDEIYLSCDPDPLTKGTTSVRVTCSFEGKTVSKSFDNIVVNEAALVSLVADSDARKKVYKIQEKFDPTGLKVKATYNNGEEEILSEDELDIDRAPLMEKGDKRISISFTCNGVTKTVYQDIYVIESFPETDDSGVYPIDSEDDLIWFTDQVNNMDGQGMDAKLTADITLKRDWTPIGTSTSKDGDYNYGRYTGSFDGAGHTVSGLHIDNDEAYQGFFGYVGAAEIRDLTVSGSITAGTGSAGIAGNVRGTAAAPAKITGCVSRVDVTAVGDYAAGIAGESIGNTGESAGNVIIEGCINRGSVSNAAAGKNGAGGIAGSFETTAGTIKDCINLGEVSSQIEAGGIAGRQRGSSENCYSLAKVTAVKEEDGKTTDTAGALFGYFATTNDVNSHLYYLSGIAAGVTGDTSSSAGKISYRELPEDILDGMDTDKITIASFSYLYVSDKIKELKELRSSRELTLNDKSLVSSVRTWYDSIPDADKDKITPEELKVLTDAEAEIALLANKPSKVSSVKTASVSYSSLKVSWSKVSGATGYQVYRSTSKSSGYSKLKTTTAFYLTDTSRTCGKTYYYKVRAYKTFAHGDKKLTSYGDWSAVASGKPVPAVPGSVKAKAGTKKATVSWKKVSGASGYQVYRSTKKSSGFKNVKTITKGSTVKFVNKSLKKKKTYYYKVRAYRTVGKTKVYGSFSAVKSVKTK